MNMWDTNVGSLEMLMFIYKATGFYLKRNEQLQCAHYTGHPEKRMPSSLKNSKKSNFKKSIDTQKVFFNTKKKKKYLT